MKIERFLFVVLVCIAACICFENVTFAAGEVPGVTKDSIRIGVSVPLTKVLARGGRNAVEAYQAYTNYINDTGGIHGRKIVLIIDDSQFDPSISLGIFKKQITNDNIFAHISWGAPPSSVLIKPATEENIPLAISSTTKAFSMPPKKYVFCISTPFELQAATCVTYIHDVLKKKDAKIAIFYRNDDYGQSVLLGAREAAKYYKYDVVAEPSYIMGQAFDVASEVMKIKQAKADFVILGVGGPDHARILGEAKNQGLKAQFFGGAGPGSERSSVFPAGDAAEGYIAAFATAMFRETNVPGVKKMLEISRKYGVKEETLSEGSFFYSISFFNYMIFVEPLRLAGPDLTREKYITASEKLKNFTAEGLGPPSSFSPTRRYSSDACFLGQVDLKINDFQRKSDWMVPPKEVIQKVGY
jgi:branched-chain amino acid transport system substrate-binding protein